MGDLIVGYVAIAALALTLFLLSAWLAGNLSPRGCEAAAALVVLLMFGYIRCVWDSPDLADWLPLSNLIVLGNWLPLFAAVIGGLVWRRMSGLAGRRAITVAQLGVCGAFAAAYPLLGSAPECGDQWDARGTCLQTTNHTCSPACAATLLRKHGISATEQEMARLCLTRNGTSWQGLYRGLKLKTAGTPWDVVVCSGPANKVAALGGPAILSVGLPGDAPANTDFTREFGWVPGVNHSVILEGFSGNSCAEIADPSQAMCREQWDAETLATLWRGQGMCLVRRPAAGGR